MSDPRFSLSPIGRWLRRMRRLFSPEGFALGPIWAQLVIIFGCSALVIVAASPFLGSVADSYRIFVDPSAYADAEGVLQGVLGLLQVLLGLVLFSFIISVLSAALDQLIDRIRGGTLPYNRRGHVLIVHHNARLPLLLDEMAVRARRLGQACHVVLLLPDRETLDEVAEQFDLEHWPELQISLRQGSTTEYETYQRLGVEHAFGLVVLASDTAGDAFATDNLNLKILACLSNAPQFMRHLEVRQKALNPVKCSVELSAGVCSREIALAMTRFGRDSLFAIINPDDVIVSVLSRSIIDIVYYKVYFELLSFHGHSVHFVSPERFRNAGVTTGRDYAQLMLGFSGGTLAGYSRTDAEGRFCLRLCPFGEPLQTGDWLLFITSNVDALAYTAPDNMPASAPVVIRPPGKHIHRRLCVIGSTWPVQNLESFLDHESQVAMRAAHFHFDQKESYFAPDFVASLRDDEYDYVIINLDDETGFRLTLHIISACESDDPFLGKVVTVLSDPVVESLLNNNARYRNTVLSHKLAAKYIAQVSFQKSLDKFFQALVQPKGVEFHLLKVGDDVPAQLLADAQQLRTELAALHISFVGSVDAQRNVSFGTSALHLAVQLLVLTGKEE